MSSVAQHIEHKNVRHSSMHGESKSNVALHIDNKRIHSKMESKDKSPLGLEKCKFVYDSDMQRMWVESNTIFLTWVVAKHSQSVKALLLVGEVVVTEVDEDAISKFDTKEAEKVCLVTLKH